MTLIVSETWVNDHQGDPGTGGAAGGSDVQARLTTLQKAIDRLRDETGTGWVGRQDDVTGYLSELSGGSWPGTPTAFMDDYGPDLFGVDSTVLRLGEPDTVTVPGIVTTKADPGRRRRPGPRRVPRLRRARRPADRRPGPGLPRADGADGPAGSRPTRRA